MHSLLHYHLDYHSVSLCVRCESSIILPIVPPQNSSSVKTKGFQPSDSQNLVIDILIVSNLKYSNVLFIALIGTERFNSGTIIS